MKNSFPSPKPSATKANLRLIAEETQVSISTVSRVLSGYAYVATDTRERVLKAAEKFRYRPNLLVRGIQTGSTQTIGVIIPMVDSFHMDILRGIHDMLAACDRVPIVVWPVKPANGEGTGELEQIHRLVDRRVDGVILRPTEDAASDEYLHEIHERDIPLVSVDRELTQSRAHFVGCDDLALGRCAAETLLSMGHRKLAHLAGPEFTSTGRYRRKGFEEAIAAFPGASCVSIEEQSYRFGRENADWLLKDSEMTAVFAANDHLAASIYEAAEKCGRKIGDDLAVIGCGNFSFSSYLKPGLTTFDQQPYQIGCEAARLLLEKTKSEGDHSFERILLHANLVVRESTIQGPLGATPVSKEVEDL